MLVGGLKAGYGLSQAITVVADELPSPTATEFRRVLRAMHLGVPLPIALDDMASRVQSDDLDLVVTAIAVQSELGGNLAQVLDTIGETIRERIRILAEVRVLTSQQRATGYILALLPVGLAIGIRPDESRLLRSVIRARAHSPCTRYCIRNDGGRLRHYRSHRRH